MRRGGKRRELVMVTGGAEGAGKKRTSVRGQYLVIRCSGGARAPTPRRLSRPARRPRILGCR